MLKKISYDGGGEVLTYSFTPYLWLLIISGLTTLFLGFYTLIKCRHSKGAISFAIAMFIVTLWSIPNAIEMSLFR